MYKYFFFLVFVLGCASEPTTSNNALSIEALQKAAMKQYMESPVLALPMMEKLADQYSQRKGYKDACETYLNIATIYDQTLDKKDKALFFGQKSLENAQLLKDDNQQASTLQYIGYLKGLTGKTK